ncbi:uncharacterized protein VTP21DRAFT_8158 [Calcarisporiella thermophila]|uniref:uncharacterized protein n=1 Tax=Calcarisporiella thermophila TaxID=911321 RepID=UPI003742584D
MLKNYSLVLLPLALLAAICPSFASPLAAEDNVEKRCDEHAYGDLYGYSMGNPCGYSMGYPCGYSMSYPCSYPMTTPCSYGGYGCYRPILNNAYYANAANADSCCKHRANLAANVKANECTDAKKHAHVFNTANTNVIAKRQISPYEMFGGMGYGVSPLGFGGMRYEVPPFGFGEIGYGAMPYGLGMIGYGLPYGPSQLIW